MKPKFRIHRWLAKTLPTTAFFAASAAAVSTSFAADIQWDGSDSTAWATGTNWVGDVAPGAADKAFINNITVNTPAVTADATVSELLVGFTSTTGAVDITAGTLTSAGWTVIGNGATGNGTVNITGSGSLVTNTGFGNFQIAEVAGSIGNVNVNTSGALTTGEMIVGNGGNGTLDIQAGTVTVSGVLRVATAATGAQGTINLDGGSIAVNNAVRFGASTSSVSDVNIGAGTSFTCTEFRMGEGGESSNTLDVDGTFTSTSAAESRIGSNSNTTTATNTVTVNTGGILSAEGDLVVGHAGAAGSVHTLNVNGGTVNVASNTTRWMVVGRYDGCSANVNITNGGTLKLNSGTDLKMGRNANTGGNVVNVDGGSLIGYIDNGITSDGAECTIEMGQAAGSSSATLNIKNGGLVACNAIFTNLNTTSAIINFDNGTLRTTRDDNNLIRLNGTGVREVNILAGGATIDSAGHNVRIGNAISGSAGGAFNKNGAGQLVLEQVNTYDGPTNINAGALVMGGTPATSSLTVAAGAGIGVEDPANTLGSLTVPTVSLGAGATLTIETGNDGTSSEKFIVSNSGALDISNGINLVLNQDGTTNGSLEGTYEIINYTSFIIGDASTNITVANPRPGFFYNIVDDFAGKITVEVISFDADGDGLPDDWETANGLDPFDDGSVGESSPGAKDGPNGALGNPDGDFANNLEEFQNETAANDPNDDPFNTDNDGLLDSWEITNFGNITAQTGTGDPDGDLATNVEEMTAETDPNNGDSWPDVDGDLMNDAWEAAFSIISNGSTDTDGDGFTDKEEHDASTDPSLATGSGISPIWTELKHRWSFNGNLTDSVGGSDATIVDIGVNDVTVDSTSVTMTGGAKADSDYVKLGENLIPNTTTPVTIELWAKQNTIQNWSRVFDFHTDTNEYLMMIWTQGTNDATDRVEFKDAAGTLTVNNAIQPYGTTDEHHIVMTLEPLVGTNGQTRVTVYAAPSSASDLGPAKVVGETAANLVNFQDALNALGYSPYPDNTASATYNEVRIWNGALAGWMAERMHDLGPDNVTVDDLDGDHLPDAWEAEYSFNATSLTADDDGDTFSNYAEYVAGTDPTNILSTPLDTDADGLLDSWEITHFGNIEAQDGSGDPDADGLTNEQEETAGSDPNDDDDGLTTAYENFWFGDTTTQTGSDDSDFDGFTNAQEVTLSQPNNIASTPTDVNGDFIPDSDSSQHTLAASDALGTTSFNAGLNWDDATEPVAGGTYIVKGGNLRTPTAAADITFAGDRLDLIEVWNGVPQLLLKYDGTTPITTTFPLINLNGGVIQNAANTAGTAHILAGVINIDDSGSLTSRLSTNNGGIVVDGVITGSGTLEFASSNVVTLNGVNTFTGNLNVITINGMVLGETGSLKFVPTTNGVNNVISGTGPVTLNGAFNLDLTGTSVTEGDEWDLITTTGALTIGSTFSVNGFTPDAGVAGSRIWTDGTYSFDEATGILSVGGANPDTDGDGMDDAWETDNGLVVGTDDSLDDKDGDGTNNVTEFRLGLDPSDGTSTFQATRNAAGLIEWPSVEGVTFDVQRSTNLSTWTTIATVPGTAGTASYTDPAPPAGKAFYRVLLQP